MIAEPSGTRLAWEEFFGRSGVVHVDLGCGDGTFLQAMARENPGINFLGVERLLKRFQAADRKTKLLPNVRLVRTDTMTLVHHLIPPQSVKAFYLLFPDPWPKRRHHIRRVVSRNFLAAIADSLLPHGTIYIATDHSDYFRSIQNVVAGLPWFEIVDQPGGDDLPVTTFEKRFRAMGVEIHRLELRKISPVT